MKADKDLFIIRAEPGGMAFGILHKEASDDSLGQSKITAGK